MAEDADVPALNVQVELHDLRREMAAMRRTNSEDIASLRTSIQDLLDAWSAARAVVNFAKIIGILAAAAAAVEAFIHVTRWGK